MSTVSFDLTATLSEQFARRQIGDPYYAGLAATEYAQFSTGIAAGVQFAVPPSADPTAPQTVLVACDRDVLLVLGWTTIDGAVHEVPVRQLALVTLPAGAAAYVRNDDSAVGDAAVPAKILSTS